MARTFRLSPILMGGALAAIGLTATGCSQVRYHQGYIGEQILIDSVQPGVDNRASVQATLGRPSFTSQFTTEGDSAIWYYVARDTRQLAFARPRPVDQNIVAVQFGADGNVAQVQQIGMEQVANIDPYGAETPTLGRDRSLFDELFGNIGQVGSVSQSGGTADNPGGN